MAQLSTLSQKLLSPLRTEEGDLHLTRVLVLLTVLIITIPVLVYSASITQSSDSDLVGYWRLDYGAGTTAYDSSNTSHDGSFSGNPQWVDGKFSKALEFDGNGDYILTNIDVDQSSGSTATFCAWAHPQDGSGDRDLLSTDDGGFDWAIDKNNGNWRLAYGGGYWDTGVSVISDEWQFVCGVWGSSNVLFYKNGKRYSMGSAPSYDTSDYYFQIGANSQYNEYWNGKIDGVRVYSRALSQSEIKALYNQGAARFGKETAETSGKVLEMDFDKISGTTVYDTSGNENHGTAQNGASQETAVHCKEGRCFSFDGDNDKVTFPNSAMDDFKTFSFWFNADSIDSGGRDWTENALFFDNGDNTDDNEFAIHLYSSNTISAGWSGAGYDYDVVYSGITTETWYRVAVVVTDTQNELYINGVLQDTNSNTAGIRNYDSISDAPQFGHHPGSYTGFDGKIDQVRIYDRTLSQQEIIEEADLKAKGAVLDLRFDSSGGDIVYDHSAHSNDGSLLPDESSGPTWTDGKTGNALSFDGNDDYVEISNGVSGIANAEELTFSFWIKSDWDFNSGNGGYQTLIGQGSDWDHFVSLCQDTAGELNWDLRYGDGTDDRLTHVDMTPYRNKWTHVTGVFDGSNAYIYVNGEEKAAPSVSKNTLPDVAGDDLNVAENPFSSRILCNSKIDNVRIYPYALSAQEVKEDYAQGSSRIGNSSRSPQDPGRDGLILDQNLDRVEVCGQDGTLSCPAGMSGKIAVDESGRGNHGDLNGASEENTATCKRGNCLSYDGSDGVIVSSNSDFSSHSFTLSAWVYRTDNSDWDAVIENDNGGTRNWWFGGWSGSNCVHFRTDPSNQGPGCVSGSLPLKEWTHVTGVHTGDDGQMILYINGEEVASTSFSGTVDTSSGPVGIGVDGDGGGWEFNGKIDEARVYNRALSREEVWSLYTQGRDKSNSNKWPGAKGYWRLDEGGGTEIHDAAENYLGNTQGSPTWLSGENCKSGNCLQLDGNNDYIDFSNDITFSENDWSILLWMKSEDITKHIHFTGVSSQHANGWSPLSHFGHYNKKLAWWDSDGWRFGDTTLKESKWYHVGLTNDGGKITFWLNGNKDGSNTCNINPIAYLGAIGLREHGNDRFFQGKIDDIRIYPYKLTKEQVKQVMNQGAASVGG